MNRRTRRYLIVKSFRIYKNVLTYLLEYKGKIDGVTNEYRL